MSWYGMYSGFGLLTQHFGQRAFASCLILLLVTYPQHLSLAITATAQNTVHQVCITLEAVRLLVAAP